MRPRRTRPFMPSPDSIAADVVAEGYEMLIEDEMLPYEEREYPDHRPLGNPYPAWHNDGICPKCKSLGCACRNKRQQASNTGEVGRGQ